MAQFAVPDGQTANAWTLVGGTENWQCIDEGCSSHDSDTTKVWTNGNNNTDGSLSNVTDPQVNTGHVLRCVTKYVGAGRTFTLELYQTNFSTLIATLSVNQADQTTSYSTFEYTLTTTEADNITNYNLLLWRLDAAAGLTNRACHVTAVELEVPDPAGGDIGYLADTMRRKSLATIRRL